MPTPVEGKQNEWFVSEEEQREMAKGATLSTITWVGKAPQRVTGVGLFLPNVAMKVTPEQAELIAGVGDPHFVVSPPGTADFEHAQACSEAVTGGSHE